MSDLFERAVKIIRGGGIEADLRRRATTIGGFGVRDLVPIRRRGEVVGAALLLKKEEGVTADPFGYYEGKQVAVTVEPRKGKRPRVTIRSAADPEDVLIGERGRLPVRRIASEAIKTLRQSPASYWWAEGMAGEESNMR